MRRHLSYHALMRPRTRRICSCIFRRGFPTVTVRTPVVAVSTHCGAPCGHAMRTPCRCQTTSATAAAAAPPKPLSGFANISPRASDGARSPRPPAPPLSVLSWAVDGSCHTHHHCQRRLPLSQRIPLMREAIVRVAPDVVALQDSTPELAEALTSGKALPADGEHAQVKVYGLELARELLLQPRLLERTEAESAPLEASEGTHVTNSAELSCPPDGAACTYRLVGCARNGRCGEVQVFVRSSSPWEAELLPGLGAGLTVELRSRIPDNRSKNSNDHNNAEDGKLPFTGASVEDEVAHVHRCVLTALDLSYRGKSLGTHLQGMLSDAAVSAEGSPFTLQTQQPSTAVQSRSGGAGRAAGQLDAHRAAAFDWVHHHIRPDLLVGNVFMGARERVPGFEDAWVRAGSPSGQERTTNTCARHRVDRLTNYYYFRPSPGVATAAAMAKMTHMEELLAHGDGRGTAAGLDGNSTEEHQKTPRESDANEAAASAQLPRAVEVVVPSDAPVGTPIPLNAALDATDGTWRAPLQRSREDASQPLNSLRDITTGMPEVAGRFQRCLFRAWERRGPPSRSGHLSAHPFLRHYRRCRVVVLRPMTEVDLDADEQAWQARYIAAQYHHTSKKPFVGTLSAAAEGDAEGEEAAGEEAAQPLEARVPTRVRCSLSDQYPLLTVLN